MFVVAFRMFLFHTLCMLYHCSQLQISLLLRRSACFYLSLNFSQSLPFLSRVIISIGSSHCFFSLTAQPRWEDCQADLSTHRLLAAHATSWTKAEVVCNRYGGTLAMPKSGEDNQCIHELTNRVQEDAWLGMTGELVATKLSHFRYTDGEIVGHISNWTTSRPANIAPHTCVKITTDRTNHTAGWRVDTGRGWTDAFCSDHARPVCQREKPHFSDFSGKFGHLHSSITCEQTRATYVSPIIF